jgi:hypothetical protein
MLKQTLEHQTLKNQVLIPPLQSPKHICTTSITPFTLKITLKIQKPNLVVV